MTSINDSGRICAHRGSIRSRRPCEDSPISTSPKDLPDQEFVEYCYRTILKRNPADEETAYYTEALGAGHLERSEVLIDFLSSEEFNAEPEGYEYVPPGHFYSSIPSTQDRELFRPVYPGNDLIPGIDLNSAKQFELLGEFKKYHDECTFPVHKEAGRRYYFDNPAYSYTDALTLYSMIRHFKPRRIIEVGSGFSSCVTLDTNDLHFEGSLDLTFVEPFPELLDSLLDADDHHHKILRVKLQDIGKEIFQELEANDILFIDSTHVAKLGSDVVRIFFDILPALKKGVLIHFHDIFWPFEYPIDWIQEGRSWNEIYLLRAFLEYNRDFEILFFASFLHHRHEAWFKKNMPLYLKNRGGNFWMRKTTDS